MGKKILTIEYLESEMVSVMLLNDLSLRQTCFAISHQKSVDKFFLLSFMLL